MSKVMISKKQLKKLNFNEFKQAKSNFEDNYINLINNCEIDISNEDFIFLLDTYKYKLNINYDKFINSKYNNKETLLALLLKYTEESSPIKNKDIINLINKNIIDNAFINILFIKNKIDNDYLNVNNIKKIYNYYNSINYKFINQSIKDFKLNSKIYYTYNSHQISQVESILAHNLDKKIISFIKKHEINCNVLDHQFEYNSYYFFDKDKFDQFYAELYNGQDINHIDDLDNSISIAVDVLVNLIITLDKSELNKYKINKIYNLYNKYIKVWNIR